MPMPYDPELSVLHGSGVPITDEGVIDMSQVIYRLDPARNPLVLFMSMMQTKPITQVPYTWLERAGFYRRTFTGTWIKEVVDTTKHVLGLQFNAKFWNAIAASLAGTGTDYDAYGDADIANMVKIRVSTFAAGEIDPGTNETTFVGYIKRSALENGKTTRYMYDDDTPANATAAAYHNTIWLSRDAAADYAGIGTSITDTNHEAEVIVDTNEYVAGTAVWDASEVVHEADAYVTVEFPNMQQRGYRQGSGPGIESFTVSKAYYNYPQIFKSPYSVTRTADELKWIGGPEMMKRRLETGMSHASDIEYALLFQGGGEEGVDWGDIGGHINPLHRFKGLGIGHAAGEEGWIVSNNGNPAHNGGTMDGSAPCQLIKGDYTSWMNLMERLWDDMKQSAADKWMFCSSAYIRDISEIATDVGSGFELDRVSPTGILGVAIKSILTPFGTMRFVHHPMFAGPFHRYGLVLDMGNITMRELHRTTLEQDIVKTGMDGRVDQYLTELGIEVRHEHTHAITWLAEAT